MYGGSTGVDISQHLLFSAESSIITTEQCKGNHAVNSHNLTLYFHFCDCFQLHSNNSPVKNAYIYINWCAINQNNLMSIRTFLALLNMFLAVWRQSA